MRVLCIVGMPCSGKTTVSNIAREMGIFTVATGNIVREEIQRRGLTYNEVNDFKIAEWFHEYGRERELMRRIVDKIIEANHPDPIVIEGLRSSKQINELKKRLWGEKLFILAVHASPKLRWEREKNRPRFNHKGYRNVKLRDKRELSLGSGDLIVMADYMIVNNGSLEEFKETVKNKLIEILNINEKR